MWKREKLKAKNGYSQKYRKTVRGIHGVSPEDEKKGYGGKGLRKRKVLGLKWKSEEVMNDESGECCFVRVLAVCAERSSALRSLSADQRRPDGRRFSLEADTLVIFGQISV